LYRKKAIAKPGQSLSLVLGDLRLSVPFGEILE
jgi:hypothetical protein